MFVNLEKARGFTLVEVLVSLMLLSFTLLGLDAMQVKALRGSRETYFFAVAENQLQVISEQLRALNFRAGLSQQVAIWNEENNRVLPQGRGVVDGAFPVYTLAIFWGDNTQNSCVKNHTGQSGCLSEEIHLKA